MHAFVNLTGEAIEYLTSIEMISLFVCLIALVLIVSFFLISLSFRFTANIIQMYSFLQRSLLNALVGDSESSSTTVDQVRETDATVDPEIVDLPDAVTETEEETVEQAESALTVESVQETSSTATESSGDTEIDFEIVTHENSPILKEMAEFDLSNGSGTVEAENERNEATDKFTRPLQTSKSLSELELKRQRLR